MNVFIDHKTLLACLAAARFTQVVCDQQGCDSTQWSELIATLLAAQRAAFDSAQIDTATVLAASYHPALLRRQAG